MSYFGQSLQMNFEPKQQSLCNIRFICKHLLNWFLKIFVICHFDHFDLVQHLFHITFILKISETLDSEQVPLCDPSFQKHTDLWTFEPHGRAEERRRRKGEGGYVSPSQPKQHMITIFHYYTHANVCYFQACLWLVVWFWLT